METLVYFGSHNLQKGIFTVSLGDWRSSSPELVQLQTPARAHGDSVVNVRTGSKSIEIEGMLKSSETTSADQIEEALKQMDQIFNVKESHYLRSVPNYLEIIPTDTTTGWTATNDAANLAVNTQDFQHGLESLGFDIDVSASGNNYATLTYTGAAYDLSAKTGTGNIEFWLNIADTYYVESVEFRIGNDSSNYYSSIFSTDYEGNAISNGVSLFSADWASMTETGAVDDSALDYCVIVINYSASAVDVASCYVDGIFWVDEDRIRNYPCYRTGSVEREGNHWNNTFTAWRASFINYKAYAISTHTYGALATSNTTASTDDGVMDLVGSIDLLPLFTITINTATQIDAVSLSNLSTGEEIEFNAGTLSNGDILTFGGINKTNLKNSSALDFSGIIPKFKPGHNRARLSVAGAADTIIPASTIVADSTKANNCGTPSAGQTLRRFISQGFTTSNANPITAFSFGWSGLGAIGTGGEWKLTTNNAGSPSGTIVASGSFTPTGSIVTVSGLNIAVSSVTVYHLCIMTDKVFGGFQNYSYNITLDYDVDAPYAGGAPKTSNDWDSTNAFGTITWSAFTGDLEFTVTQGATPAWDIDWGASYRKLYAA